MDQRLAKLLQIISLVMLSWFAHTWLIKLHWTLGALVCIFAAANACTAWMLRGQWAVLRVAVRVGATRRYLQFVCSCTGDQVPVDDSRGCGPQLLLGSKGDFEAAGQRARQVVRGHDAVINRVLVRLQENVTLRQRQKHAARKGPLAAFLLLGRDGVGKRYLTRVLAKLLYRDGTINVFECDQINAAQLTGLNGSSGELEPIRRDAHRILLFEHIDRASPELVRLFMEVLTSGKLRLAGSVNPVSLENTVIVFTATPGTDCLLQLAGHQSENQQPIDWIADATRIDRQLVHAVTESLYCVAPDDCVKCEVIALLLAQECGAHRTELSHVDPEIIATQVLQLADEHGFAPAPQLVRKLLRKPLVAAAEGDHKLLSLRVRCSGRQHQSSEVNHGSTGYH